MAGLKRLFGQQVRHYRHTREWTQARLAQEVDLSLDMIGRLERGQAAPSLDTIERMGEVLSIPAAMLLGGAPLADDVQSERYQILRRIFEMLSMVDDADLKRVEPVINAVLRD